MIKGMVIRESFANETIPPLLDNFVVERRQHTLAGVEKVHIVTVIVPTAEFLATLTETSLALKPTRFYAHFVDGRSMYVVFPRSIVIVAAPDDDQSISLCRLLGQAFSIPELQMNIPLMFKFGHSD